MQYNNSIISAFLNGTDITNEKCFCLLKNYKAPDIKRKDIVKELDYQLKMIIDEFPTFNKDLLNKIFPDMKKELNNLCILTVVGTEQNCIVEKEDTVYILIDLIHIANYTRIVSQMVYIMQNYLTLEITKYLITRQYPLTSNNYIDILNHLSFTNGLANYLAWNESCDNYIFYTPKYDTYKEKSFGLLAQALQIEDISLQHKILESIPSTDFWNQFPIIAGMFFFDDVYREKSYDGILELYNHGPKDFIHNIYFS